MPQINFVRAVEEVVQDAGGDVAHVGGAFAKVIVANRLQGGRVPLGDLLEGLFDVDLLLFHQAGHLVDQGAVFQNQQVGVENAGVLRTHRLTDLALDVQNLLTGLNKRLFEPLPFVRQFGFGDRMSRDGVVALP